MTYEKRQTTFSLLVLLCICLTAMPFSLYAQEQEDTVPPSFSMPCPEAIQPGQYVFSGTLGGKTPMDIVFHDNGKGVVAGYVYYPQAKNPDPIMIACYQDDGEGDPISENVYALRFNELLPDGTITGKLHIIYSEVEGDYNFISGEWTHPTTGKILKLSQVTTSYELPVWYPGVPASISKMGPGAFHFTHSFEKDEGGWLKAITVEAWTNDEEQTPVRYTHSLSGAFNDYQEKELTWVETPDINFDGIPDLTIFLGLTGFGMTQYFCDAYIWNPFNGCYEHVENYSEIGEPELDHDKQEIRGCLRESHDTFTHSIYKWNDWRLEEVNSQSVNPFE